MSEGEPKRNLPLLVFRTFVAALLSVIAFVVVAMLAKLLIDFVLKDVSAFREDPLVKTITYMVCALCAVMAARGVCDAVLADYSHKAIGIVFIVVFCAMLADIWLRPAGGDGFVAGDYAFAGVAALTGGLVFLQQDPFERRSKAT